jgi:lantibiotic leader peptide-processing serine protease
MRKILSTGLAGARRWSVSSATALALVIIQPAFQAADQSQSGENYLVLYRGAAVPADAGAAIARAGGTLINKFDKIGVAVARSSRSSFRNALLKDGRIEGASSTARFGTKLNFAKQDVSAGEITFEAEGEPLWGMQWDMRQINVPQAHQITTGSHSVVVGNIDTGIDYNHPDLIDNIDFANSVSCLGGVLNQDPAAWFDVHSHGTHTAGTIGAGANGLGIVGVAPNVRIATIKAGNDDGYFFPEAVVCAFMWAAERKLDVVNNSYFVDPWLFNCHNDPEQQAIWKAISRAIRHAISQGVTVVAAIGNENIDLAHPTVDYISPDWPPGNEVERTVRNNCVVIPAEIPGVITVSGTGYLKQKAFYSTYGIGVVDVAAPAGDGWFQFVGDGSRGWVLSCIPKHTTDSRSIQDPTNPDAWYHSYGGTSMAAPHVAGVAALIISRHGKMPPGAVQALIQRTADPLGCPEDGFDPDGTGDWAAHCQGVGGRTSFFGHGLVNAHNAVK